LRRFTDRAQHRFGKIRKLDRAPELKAFVLARIDRLTYEEITTEIAGHFPAERRIGKSAIWDWNQSRDK
tara:strand:- start:279 stop:485 length:207 start_codon:yes stop_codon:yes gene_type:complete